MSAPRINPFAEPSYSLVGVQTQAGTAAHVLPNPSFGMEHSIVPNLGRVFRLEIDPYYEYAHLWNSPLGSVLRFMFMDFEGGIQETAGVNYAPIEVLGRTEKFMNYVGTDNREIQLNVNFRAQGVSGATLRETLDTEVVQPAKWLDSLKYPLLGDDELSHAPPPCILIMGDLLLMRVIATEVSITWVAPFDTETMLPYGADVACTFTAVHRGMGRYAYTGARRFDQAQTRSFSNNGELSKVPTFVSPSSVLTPV